MASFGRMLLPFFFSLSAEKTSFSWKRASELLYTTRKTEQGYCKLALVGTYLSIMRSYMRVSFLTFGLDQAVFSSDSHIHGERPPDQIFTKLPHNLTKLALLSNHLQFNFTLMTASSGYNNFWKAFHHKSATDLMNTWNLCIWCWGRIGAISV